MDLDIDYVAKLARINLTKEEREKFSEDLWKVLNHFEELKEVETSDVPPMTGGTSLSNVTKPDEAMAREEAGRGVNNFPDEKDGYLRVPKVFE